MKEGEIQMGYKVNVTVRQNISEKEIRERTKQFQDAFVIAAVNYFSKNPINREKEKISEQENNK